MTANRFQCLREKMKEKLNSEKMNSFKRFALLGLYTFIIMLFISSMAFRLKYQVGVGNGISMQPTLEETNFQIMDRHLKPNYGDIVGIKIKKNDNQYAKVREYYKEFNTTQTMTKRVIALPGDSIKINGNEIFVNNELIDTTKWFFNNDTWNTEHKFDLEINDLKGYFVMGDNRGNSFDSTYFGAVYEDDIMGTVIMYTNNLTLTRVLSAVFFLDPFLLLQK